MSKVLLSILNKYIIHLSALPLQKIIHSNILPRGKSLWKTPIQKQFKEIFAKEFIHRFISKEYWNADGDTIGLMPFTPALFGFKSDTPYLDLLNAFLFGDADYEYDDCQDNWLFLKNEDGSDYVDGKGRKRTLLDFSFEDDLYVGYDWNEYTLWRAMRDHYDTAESTINAVMQYLKVE